MSLCEVWLIGALLFVAFLIGCIFAGGYKGGRYGRR